MCLLPFAGQPVVIGRIQMLYLNNVLGKEPCSRRGGGPYLSIILIYMKVPSLAMMFVASFIVRCGCVRNFGPAMLVTMKTDCLKNRVFPETNG